MAIATSISERRREWTGFLDTLGRRHAVTIHLVETVGRRCAYLAGPTEDDVAMLHRTHIQLDGDVGAVLYTAAGVTEETRTAIAAAVKQALATRP